MNKRDEFYKKLKLRLEETTSFPTKYMYKFIIPYAEDKLAIVQKLFDHMGAVITTKTSKTKKYYSITIIVKMKNANDIIEKYKAAEVIEGLISL